MIKDCEDCEARVLLDPNTLSSDGTVSLGGTSVSNDASLLAYSVSDGGSDWRIWKVIDIETGEHLQDTIEWAKFSGATWENDDSGFYYQKYDEPKDELLKDINTSPKLMFHKLGTPQSEDKIVYENPDKPRWGWGISVVKESDIKFLSISNGTDERNRLYVQLKKGEEFTCDYGFGFDEDYKQFPCKCGAKNCCGYIVREESRWRINKKFAMSNKKKLINNSR